MSDEASPGEDPAIGIHPLMARAAACHQGGHLEAAADLYREILADKPRDFDATHLLGVVALQQGRFDVAQRLIGSALSISPTDTSAMGNLGTSYMRDGKLETALQWFELAVRLQPESAVALANMGTVLHNMNRNNDAIPLLRKAFELDSNSYQACSLLGACLMACHEARGAAPVFEAATRVEPGNPEGWANLSVVLDTLGEHERARECADVAATLRPRSSSAFGALGAAQFNQGRLTEAVESYRRGVAAETPSVKMLLAFGHALMASGLNDEAIDQLQRALLLDETNLTVRWAIAMAHLKPIYRDESDLIASRKSFEKAIEDVAAWYRVAGASEPSDAVGVSQPFYIAYQPFNNRDLLRRYGAICAAWMATRTTEKSEPPSPAGCQSVSSTAADKFRVGIASAHIHDHSVWNAITKGWVSKFNRDQFEIFLFQLIPQSDMESDNAKRMVTHFADQPTSLSAWVEEIAEKDLDALIYPDIGMDPLTVRLASQRLAPLQAASWGHPETTGLPTMDVYISADAFEPQNASDNYSERLLALPNLGVYVEPLTPNVTDPDLHALKLPSNQPLLLCPGSPFKYVPMYDDVWVQIAKQLRKKLFSRNSGGRLVFFRSRSDTMDQMLEGRLRAAFAKAGVDFDKHVSIIRTLKRSDFFGLMKRSALLLDTLGFSGFNTALQAIECDLPVLAFEGEFMRGRLASAIMRRLDLPELVAKTQEEFVLKAVELAADVGTRSTLQAQIIERRKILFHDEAPVRALERHLTDAITAARAGSYLL